MGSLRGHNLLTLLTTHRDSFIHHTKNFSHLPLRESSSLCTTPAKNRTTLLLSYTTPPSVNNEYGSLSARILFGGSRNKDQTAPLVDTFLSSFLTVSSSSKSTRTFEHRCIVLRRTAVTAAAVACSTRIITTTIVEFVDIEVSLFDRAPSQSPIAITNRGHSANLSGSDHPRRLVPNDLATGQASRVTSGERTGQPPAQTSSQTSLPSTDQPPSHNEESLPRLQQDRPEVSQPRARSPSSLQNVVTPQPRFPEPRFSNSFGYYDRNGGYHALPRESLDVFTAVARVRKLSQPISVNSSSWLLLG